MRVRVGINGMGRIGRDVLRAAMGQDSLAFEIVAINDLASPDTIAYLLRHDSTYGPWNRQIEQSGHDLVVDDHTIRVLQEADPENLGWDDFGVDIVIEATGRFRTRDRATRHLTAGARKVVLTAPGTDVDATIVMGINEDTYEATCAGIAEPLDVDPVVIRIAAMALALLSSGTAVVAYLIAWAVVPHGVNGPRKLGATRWRTARCVTA